MRRLDMCALDTRSSPTRPCWEPIGFRTGGAHGPGRAAAPSMQQAHN
jgi:hypothetical protein